MSEYWRLYGRTAIALAVVWHMFAVGVYAIPTDAKDGASLWLRSTFVPTVRPYLLLTSQWQQWNLFAPDPLRRVTTYRLEMQNNGDRETVATIDERTYNRARHAARFKLYGNLFSDNDDNRYDLTDQGIGVLCREFHVPAARSVWLWREVYVIPSTTETSPAWWNAWSPAPESRLILATSCPLP
jgi:hypothetical protein